MKSQIKLGTVFGVELGLHFSSRWWACVARDTLVENAGRGTFNPCRGSLSAR